MIKSLKSKVWFASWKINFSSRFSSSVFPNLKTEQSINDHIGSLCKQRRFREALEVYDELYSTNFRIWIGTYAHLLSACSSLRSLEYGKKIHHSITESCSQPNMILNNHIVSMYGKCGSLQIARKVFDEMPERNVVSWSSVIAGYSQNGHGDESIHLFVQMRRAGVTPDHFILGSVIRACSNSSNIQVGIQLHGTVIMSGFGTHLIPQNALVSMYTKFGCIKEASDVFSRIETKDLISWSSMISGFAQLGYELEALYCFKEMLSSGNYQPNEFTFGSALSACGNLIQPEYGKQIHALSLKVGLKKDAFAGCSVSDMYAKCGILHSAKEAFYQIERPDLVAWNAIISGFAYSGDSNQAMSFFSNMRRRFLTPDEITVRSLLCSCTSPLTVNQGQQVHSYIIKMGFDLYIPVCNTLLSMYAKCLDILEAYKVFDEIRANADLVSWNAILTAYLQHNQTNEVFTLFKALHFSPYMPDHITVTNVLGACGEAASLETGNQIHCHCVKLGLEYDSLVTNGLIDMYTKCGSLVNARRIFDFTDNRDVISWSSLIIGYAQFGHGEEGLELFKKMRALGVEPNQVTFVGVLTACSHVGLVEEGWSIYTSMENEHGIIPNKEHCSCIVDMFARAGRIKEAESFINQMKFEPDVVIWKTLLSACRAQNNVEVGEHAAKNILKIDPSNSGALVLLSGIYASKGRWEEVGRLRSLMRERSIRKVPGQSWIETKDKTHVFLAEDYMHPERYRIYSMLDQLWLQVLDVCYVPDLI